MDSTKKRLLSVVKEGDKNLGVPKRGLTGAKLGVSKWWAWPNEG